MFSFVSRLRYVIRWAAYLREASEGDFISLTVPKIPLTVRKLLPNRRLIVNTKNGLKKMVSKDKSKVMSENEEKKVVPTAGLAPATFG